MIIQCPNCRFSGRIPSYAVDSPYNATCPRCRFRFELHALLADPAVGMLAEVELDAGPGSSSYELKAITGDLEQPQTTADRRDPWGDDQGAVPFNGSGDGRVDPARTGFSTAAASRETPAPSLSVSEAARAEPWYSRVLQVWGIVFLIWAAMIVARSLFLQFVPGSGPTSRSDAVSSVVSVLLLVPGAAFLFLLVDLGRYIRGLRPPEPRIASERSSPARGDTMTWRSWTCPFPSAPSARS
jgi:hypothetical protein